MILAYTNSGPWQPPGRTVPVGVIEFDRVAASLVNQKPLHLDMRVLVRIPLSQSWLPRLNTLDRGIVAQADRALRDRINAAAEQFARRRPEVIQVRGIGSLPPA